MTSKLDLILHNVCLRAHPDRVYEIGINQGKIVAISEDSVGVAELEIDVENNLVT